MIEFVRVNPKEILRQMLEDYTKASGETLYPGDERHLFLSQMAAILAAAKGAINDAGNQNLIPGARGDALDAIGGMFDVARLPASPARCTLRFSASPTQGEDIPIPAGTRATPDGQVVFATQQAAVLPRGSSHVDVPAAATEPGSQANGLLSGQIRLLADPIPYVVVENTTATSGGADAETDAAYEERIRLSYAKTSTAGAAESYLYWARSASAQVADASVSSPSPGKVTVTILPVGGGDPGQPLLDLVKGVLSSDKVRPLTDEVTVAAPREKPYTIALSYWIAPEDRSRETEIKAAVQAAVEDFVREAGSQLGRPINPDALRRKLLQAGACRIDLTAPVYTQLAPQEAPKLSGEAAVTYNGVL